jgi:RNA polymerase sigma-70 factor, ECF subfamily
VATLLPADLFDFNSADFSEPNICEFLSISSHFRLNCVIESEMEINMTLTSWQTTSKQELANIYEEHSPGLYRYAYRLLGDQDMAEECVSETFSRFLRAIRDGGGPNENARAYLYRTVHNWVMDHYRREPLPPLSIDEEWHSGEQENVSKRVAKAMLREKVRAALLRLPQDQQQVIHLRFLEDWSHEEVATQLGKSAEATRALQHRAMSALRRMLLDQEDE